MATRRTESPAPTQGVRRHLARFPKVRVLVVGDLMMDHYIWGTVDRISPEAPVPIVRVVSESLRLGGAANVLNNVLDLGGQGMVCGVIGPDDMGMRLVEALKERGVNTEGIIVERRRTTTKKTRIIAHQQQVVRFDRETTRPAGPEISRRIAEVIQRRIADLDVLVISDYAKGAVTPELITAVLEQAHRRRLPVIVDPKIPNFPQYRGVTVITPNSYEAARATGMALTDEAAVERCGRAILRQLRCQAVLITRGEHGASLFEQARATTHIPAMAQQVFDVTGAGDTVVGTLALGLGAGASMREAAALANYAAGVVVGVVGTATVTLNDLRRVLP